MEDKPDEDQPAANPSTTRRQRPLEAKRSQSLSSFKKSCPYDKVHDTHVLKPTDIKNQFLLEGKHNGLSYKEIKKLYNFTEAESTLRGRFRTLTKSKSQRVRRPQWYAEDVSQPTPFIIAIHKSLTNNFCSFSDPSPL